MSQRKAILLRMLLFIFIGIVAAGAFSEITFRLQRNNTSRSPQVVELVIPPGTSEKVARGESVLPDSQVFVLGDTLVVRNDDTVTQTLGPLVVPPGSSASMKLDKIGNMSYTCSFQPSQYYGIQVNQAVTWDMRLQAALLAGIPLGLLIGLYSLVAKPLKPASKST